jgi:hypothetical protein
MIKESIEPDFAVIRNCSDEVSRRQCEQEVASLCQKYGAGTVRHALAKVTTGRPKKNLERYSEFWLAVELYRFHNNPRVKSACDGVASFFRREAIRAKETKEIYKFPSGDRRRHYYRMRKGLGEDSYLRLILQIHIACPHVVISGPGPCHPTFENTIEFALCDLRV